MGSIYTLHSAAVIMFQFRIYRLIIYYTERACQEVKIYGIMKKIEKLRVNSN